MAGGKKVKLILDDSSVPVECEAMAVASGDRRISGDVLLDDGNVIRVDLVITAIYKILGRTDSTGLPLYHVRHQVVLGVLPGAES